MTRKATILYAAAAVLYVLHQDFPLWGNATLVLGLVPAGLLYHILFCLAASGLMFGLTRHAWPHHLDEVEAEGSEEGRPWK